MSDVQTVLHKLDALVAERRTQIDDKHKSAVVWFEQTAGTIASLLHQKIAKFEVSKPITPKRKSSIKPAASAAPESIFDQENSQSVVNTQPEPLAAPLKEPAKPEPAPVEQPAAVKRATRKNAKQAEPVVEVPVSKKARVSAEMQPAQVVVEESLPEPTLSKKSVTRHSVARQSVMELPQTAVEPVVEVVVQPAVEPIVEPAVVEPKKGRGRKRKSDESVAAPVEQPIEQPVEQPVEAQSTVEVMDEAPAPIVTETRSLRVTRRGAVATEPVELPVKSTRGRKKAAVVESAAVATPTKSKPHDQVDQHDEPSIEPVQSTTPPPSVSRSVRPLSAVKMAPALPVPVSDAPASVRLFAPPRSVPRRPRNRLAQVQEEQTEAMSVDIHIETEPESKSQPEAVESTEPTEPTSGEPVEPVEQPARTTRPTRGRPAAEKVIEPVVVESKPVETKRRGRPPKAALEVVEAVVVPEVSVETIEEPVEEVVESKPAKKLTRKQQLALEKRQQLELEQQTEQKAEERVESVEPVEVQPIDTVIEPALEVPEPAVVEPTVTASEIQSVSLFAEQPMVVESTPVVAQSEPVVEISAPVTIVSAPIESSSPPSPTPAPSPSPSPSPVVESALDTSIVPKQVVIAPPTAATVIPAATASWKRPEMKLTAVTMQMRHLPSVMPLPRPAVPSSSSTGNKAATFSLAALSRQQSDKMNSSMLNQSLNTSVAHKSISPQPQRTSTDLNSSLLNSSLVESSTKVSLGTSSLNDSFVSAHSRGSLNSSQSSQSNTTSTAAPQPTASVYLPISASLSSLMDDDVDIEHAEPAPQQTAPVVESFALPTTTQASALSAFEAHTFDSPPKAASTAKLSARSDSFGPDLGDLSEATSFMTANQSAFAETAQNNSNDDIFSPDDFLGDMSADASMLQAAMNEDQSKSTGDAVPSRVLAPVSSTQVKPKPKPATLAVPVAAADKKSPPPHVKALKAAELARAHQLQREQEAKQRRLEMQRRVEEAQARKAAEKVAMEAAAKQRRGEELQATLAAKAAEEAKEKKRKADEAAALQKKLKDAEAAKAAAHATHTAASNQNSNSSNTAAPANGFLSGIVSKLASTASALLGRSQTEGSTQASNTLPAGLTASVPTTVPTSAPTPAVKPIVSTQSSASVVAVIPAAVIGQKRHSSQTIQIADYKSSDEESEEESPSAKKRVPAWASSPALRAQLANQTMETDEFFPPQHAKTCDLDEVFKEFKKTKRFYHRSSSGNWER